MASTDKTPKLGLNQWAAGDKVLRADFNADNGKIDAGVQGAMEAAAAAHALAAGKATMVTGGYTGDGVDNRIFIVGSRPKLLILQGMLNHSPAMLIATTLKFFTLVHTSPAIINSFSTGENDGAMLKFLDNGFRMGLAQNFNVANAPYHYVAFY